MVALGVAGASAPRGLCARAHRIRVGHYTLKVYHSEKVADPDNGWQHQQIVLKPLNPAFQPITLKAGDGKAVRAIAEFVRVL